MEECPVSATTYGYAPNLGGNLFFLILFALSAIAQMCLAIKYKLYAFGAVVTLGCAGECVDYIGRVLMHYNAWFGTGFRIQIICLMFVPHSLLLASTSS